jgi:hypothetical protein
MADLDDIYAQIPTSEIANRLGADEGEVDSAIHTLVPVLLGGLEHNAQDPEHASKIESAASTHAAGDGDGQQAVAALFGGNDSDQVAAALAKGGAGDGDLLKKLLPILLPIVLAYIGKRLSPDGEKTTTASKKEEASGGALGEILGSILGGSSGDKGLGGVLGSVLGGKGGALGDILGGLLGGKK